MSGVKDLPVTLAPVAVQALVGQVSVFKSFRFA